MTQGELEKLAQPFVEHVSRLEQRIMEDIIRRIKINGFSTATADWQISRVKQLGESDKDIKKWIKEALKASDEDIDKIFSDTVYEEYYKHQRAYKSAGVKQMPFEKNAELQQLIKGVRDQTSDELRNMTASLGFARAGPDGKILYDPLQEFYRDTLDAAMMDIHSGAFGYSTVLTRTINTMTSSGLRWIDYESGHRDRVDVAARRAIMTGFRQIQGKINEQVAEQLHTDQYEVTWHAGARPTHQAWQGRVWTMMQLQEVCGLGDVAGLHGANCYHDFNAFPPGSIRTYTDAQLEEMNRQENTPNKYGGKEYTTYEALQKQRSMERGMRKTRQDINLLKHGGADQELVTLKKVKYQSQMQAYKDFSKKMGLPEQWGRVYQDGLRVTAGSAGTVVKSGKKSIINNKWRGIDYPSRYTSSEAIARLKSAYGINFTDSRKYPMDEDLLADCVGWMDSFSRQFPGFIKNNPVKLPELKCQAPSKMKGSIGYYSYYSHTDRALEIALNGAYHSDVSVFQQYVDKCVKSGWYPKNATVHKTFVHEYGHYVSHSMERISEESGWQRNFILGCIDDYNKQTGSSIRTCKDCADLVSRYGATKDSELFAEAFAEYFGGDNPREFAIIFGNKLEKILKGVK